MSGPEVTLLPCPFCGGSAKYYYHTPAGMSNCHHVECDDCGNGTCLHETEAEAIAAWNTRTAATEPLEAQIAVLCEALQEIERRSDEWNHCLSSWSGALSMSRKQAEAVSLEAEWSALVATAALAKIEAMKENSNGK